MLRDAVQRWSYRLEPGPGARLAARCAAWIADRRGRRPRPAAPVPTIVVGALSMGGAGKTPVLERLARHLLAAGHRVGIVARGYGGRIGGVAPVPAPDGRRFGDEPADLRRRLPAALEIWVGRPRVAAWAAAARRADVVLVDDGFQDPALPRSADVVVVDATAPREVLPAGPLREPLTALARADLVWLHKVDEPGARRLPAAVHSVVAARAILGPDGRRFDPSWLRGREVTLLSGVGRPSSFRHTAERLGARVVAAVERGDHHRFGAADLARALAPGRPVVTTTKDRERLPPDFPAFALEIEVAVRSGWPAVEALLSRVLGC